MEPITVNYKVLDPRAKVPAYATPGAAAADLCAVLDEPLTLDPMQRALVPTGLAIELPGPHAVALVYARSGLSIKHGLCMATGVGVVDSDYRGELKVPMVNLGAEAYTIQPGERVAQLCIAPVYTAAFVQALLMCPSRPSAVVDAAALHALAMHPEALSSLRACDVLTPHPGEAATLLHTTPALVQADRFAALAGLRRLAPSVWILKGAGTLIGTEGQPVTIAPYAEPNLAVGGSGDVLSGCLGTLMAQTAAHPSEVCESSSFLAACMGVHLHARAGRLLREAFPQRGNSATDIAEMLPRARIREAAGDGA